MRAEAARLERETPGYEYTASDSVAYKRGYRQALLAAASTIDEELNRRRPARAARRPPA